MKNLLVSVLISFLLLSAATAQTFTAKGGELRDYGGGFAVDSFPIQVSGLPNRIDSSFGLGKVCFFIQHERVSDLKVELLSPDGTSIWLTNRNGLDGQHYFNTCFRSNGFSGFIHQAKAPFIGEFVPDGRMEFLNNGQNPNGTWRLLVQDLRTGLRGRVDELSLTFSKDPMPNLARGACRLNHPSACTCPGGKSGCELLPDLIILPSFTKNQVKEYAPDDPVYPRQIRFAASIANIGSGPVEMYGKKEWYCGSQPTDSGRRCANGRLPQQKLVQRIYKKQGDSLTWTEHEAGYNYYDEKPGHNHYHVDNWVAFRLVKKTKLKNGSFRSSMVASGRKVSFCLFDYGICNNETNLCAFNGTVYGQQTLANYGLGGYRDCSAGKQGISVGGYDTYGMLYEGQYIQLPKGLPSGTYYLQIEADPLHFIRETNPYNNGIEIPVEIKLQQKK